MTRGGALLNSEIAEVFDGAGEDGFIPAHDDGALNEIGISHHEVDELFGGEVFARHVIAISGFILADGILWFHSGKAEQVLKLIGRKGFIEVVNGLEVEPVVSQGTLDLAASASGRFFVNCDSVRSHKDPLIATRGARGELL